MIRDEKDNVIDAITILANDAAVGKNHWELKSSNVNLEEFAYAASHDLKEPIRKIHFFSDRLKSVLKERLDGEEIKTFERVEMATKRMSSLIDDLLAYSQVSLRPRTFEEVNLNQIIALVLNDLDLEIEDMLACFSSYSVLFGSSILLILIVF
jgi:light-regulated signal transduction histidine kinase (bacteriophytochrome)